MTIDNGRVAEVGRDLARRDHERRRPRREESVRFWAPAFRQGYDEERARLGDCAPAEHVYRPERVTGESPQALRNMRPLGALIETCERCGVWQDRPR